MGSSFSYSLASCVGIIDRSSAPSHSGDDRMGSRCWSSYSSSQEPPHSIRAWASMARWHFCGPPKFPSINTLWICLRAVMSLGLIPVSATARQPVSFTDCMYLHDWEVWGSGKSTRFGVRQTMFEFGFYQVLDRGPFREVTSPVWVSISLSAKNPPKY